MTKATELKKLRKKNKSKIVYRDFESNLTEDSIESYYNNLLTNDEIEKALIDYKGNMKQVTEEFKEKTGLNGKDIGFLIFATMLQCGRIYVMNHLTKIENANINGGREDRLHKFQKKVFDKFHTETEVEIENYYAPLEFIITSRGVPYDATGYKEEKLGLFKGGNHRFATLGHDPLLGLIFGTANILTNSITCIRTPIITTNHVCYDNSLKNPRISEYDSTLKMLNSAMKRMDGDVESVVAAIIKQLIHIGTDIYTPCGIQIPMSSLMLNRENIDKLTKYVSSGDLLKATTSANLSMLINMIISTVHGLDVFSNLSGEKFSEELYSIRTKKIILYSNLIASSSNIIETAINKKLKNFDLGGFAVTCYRVFSDTQFIDKIKYEFLNVEVSKVYHEKIKNIERYY